MLIQIFAKTSLHTSNNNFRRPSGNIQEDIRSEVAILKREKLKQLQKILSDLEAQNKLLVDRVQKKEQHLLRTRDKMMAIADDFEPV